MLSSTIIIILGFANLPADGFSIATGNYLGTRSEIQARKYGRYPIKQNDWQHFVFIDEGKSFWFGAVGGYSLES
jgi:hypothetical protein